MISHVLKEGATYMRKRELNSCQQIYKLLCHQVLKTALLPVQNNGLLCKSVSLLIWWHSGRNVVIFIYVPCSVGDDGSPLLPYTL